MLNKITFIALMLACTLQTSFAQAPHLINYQGVARHSNGTSIANQLIAVRLSIHNATASGAVQYSETRTLTTDAEGFFNLQIGSTGTTGTTGSWAAITWDNGAKYLQVEMDTSGGATFLNMGTQQLVSVPYAQYAKQAASLIPTATINPTQINAGGASVNEILKFDGTQWIPSAVSAATLPLPYIVTDPNLVSFAITNTSAVGGTAVTGKNTVNHVNSTGVRGECTGVSGTGVKGIANGGSSFGVFGQNPIGVAIKGTTTTGKGIAGEVTGTTGKGVEGVSNGASGIGVYGESSNGIGIKGYGNNASSIGVFGSSLAGTGVLATSYTGYALDVSGYTRITGDAAFNGNVTISGGNSNPTSGAVLTSDAFGTATWKNNRIAFGARGINNSYSTMPHNVFQKVEFNIEDYDLGSNFLPTAGSLNSNTSVFTVPVSGVYNINSKLVVWVGSSFTNISFTEIRVQRLRSGTTSTLLRSTGYINTNSSYDHSEPSIVSDFYFQVGDKVWIEIRQANDDGDPATLGNSSNEDDVWFRASLLVAD